MSQPAVPSETSRELVILTDIDRPFSNDQLSDIGGFSDALELVESTGLTLVDSSKELGNGFIKTDNKEMFVDVPFVALMWSFHEGDFGDEPFTAIHLVTRDGGKYILTDGSTGIRDELKKWTENNNGRTSGMLCETGLSKSVYKYCEACGSTNSAKAVKCRGCGEVKKLNTAKTYYMH